MEQRPDVLPPKADQESYKHHQIGSQDLGTGLEPLHKDLNYYTKFSIVSKNSWNTTGCAEVTLDEGHPGPMYPTCLMHNY